MIRPLSVFIILVMATYLTGQSDINAEMNELHKIASDYQLSDVQKTEVEKLIVKRNEDLAIVASNNHLDEPQKAIKRLSIEKGFNGSVNLLLNEDQKSLEQVKRIKNRKDRIAAIELLKKKGYSQSQILKQLDHQ